MRVFRGADAASDHHLVKAKIKLKLKKPKTAGKSKPRPFDVGKLRDINVRDGYQLELRNRFGSSDLVNEDVEERWRLFTEAVMEAAEASVGRKRGTAKEEWISDEAWKLIGKRKKQKTKTFDDNNEPKEEYKRWDREVKKKCRSDRQAWVDEKAAGAKTCWCQK